MKYVLAKPLSIYQLGQRKNQEDSIYPKMGEATDKDRLFVLCDGMGGHEAGEVASACVCQVLGEYLSSQVAVEDVFTEEQFNRALQAAYDALDEKDHEDEAKKMGTTMTFLKLHTGGCLVAHIGDSRIYHIRPSEKKILYVSRDHSLVRDLYELGEITFEEMKTSKQKNIITRAMQPHQEKRAKADVRNIEDIRPGDFFFMCSDGMLEEIEDDNLVNILSDEKTTDEEKIEILVQVSNDSRDNHSAHLIHILDVLSEGSECQEDISIENAYHSEILREETLSKSASNINVVAEENPMNRMTSSGKLTKVLKTAIFLVILFAVVYFVAIYVLEHFHLGDS